MEFSKQDYWSGLSCPLPGHLPDPGINPASPPAPALAGGFFGATGEAHPQHYQTHKNGSDDTVSVILF